MVKILVVHNNERERLDYLVPQLNQLIASLRSGGRQALLELVGPDTDLIMDNRSADNLFNRFRRAAAASRMYYSASREDPRRLSLKRRCLDYIRHFTFYLKSYKRSIKIEQEVLYAHVFCWQESVRLGEAVIVLESDAILHEHTQSGLQALLAYLQQSYGPEEKYYVDLAGGCDRDEILRSWCFDRRHGCVSFDLIGEPQMTLHKLPKLVTNTVGGYLLSPGLAADFLQFAQKSRPMTSPDWAINTFAAQKKNRRNVLCIHLSPTLFTQGSFSGAYRSTIEPPSERR